MILPGRLVDRWRTSIAHCPPTVRAEIAWEGRNHQLGLTALEGASDPVQARLNDWVGQLEVLEALPELGQFFFLAALQVLGCFAVLSLTRLTLGKERGK